MSIKVPQNKKIAGGKDGVQKGVGSGIRRKRSHMGAYTLRNKSEEQLFRKMLILT